jgi:hypothetical protein
MKSNRVFTTSTPRGDIANAAANSLGEPGRIAVTTPRPEDGTATWRKFANAILQACDHIDAPEPPIQLTVELSEEDVREWVKYNPTLTGSFGRGCSALYTAARDTVAKLDGEGGAEATPPQGASNAHAAATSLERSIQYAKLCGGRDGETTP